MAAKNWLPSDMIRLSIKTFHTIKIIISFDYMANMQIISILVKNRPKLQPLAN